MVESCSVAGLGFVNIVLSNKWIEKVVQKRFDFNSIQISLFSSKFYMLCSWFKNQSNKLYNQ
ncbi:putative arginine--tRNA ligase [Medicago truncatula]|uniref:Putative arginine--tRNA ligase n=1 Tax=Medicago truncatula TaxID=3880 RepID=A0A396HAQ7_MEDTR|nr:putative arginine--tRNA ligase [Medicago truncatula]